MRIFRSLRSRVIAGLAVISAAVLIPVIAHAVVSFGPSRPTFTWNVPATYVTFNSITDNPSYGDERYLLEARDASASTSTYAKTMAVSDNQDVVLEVYFHNNAASNLNLTATNTKVKVALPTIASATLSPTATVSADNANPTAVFANVDLTNASPFTVEYVPGSAQLWTNYVNGASVSDSVVTSGALVGTNGTDGNVPGCGQFSGYVTLHVKVRVVKPAVTPSYSCDLLSVTALPNRKIDASVTYTAKDGASLQSVKYDFGDGSTPLVTNSTSVSYIYAKDGTYTVVSTLTFNLGSTTATSSCSKQVTIATPPTPPVVTPPTTPVVTPPATPQVGKGVLPNTGPGSIAAIFAGVSAFAGASHYFVTRRARL